MNDELRVKKMSFVTSLYFGDAYKINFHKRNESTFIFDYSPYSNSVSQYLSFLHIFEQQN